MNLLSCRFSSPDVGYEDHVPFRVLYNLFAVTCQAEDASIRFTSTFRICPRRAQKCSAYAWRAVLFAPVSCRTANRFRAERASLEPWRRLAIACAYRPQAG